MHDNGSDENTAPRATMIEHSSRADSVRVGRKDLHRPGPRVSRITAAKGEEWIRTFILALVSMNHRHQSRMFLEDVVRERDEHDDGRRWSMQRQAGETFDEGC